MKQALLSIVLIIWSATMSFSADVVVNDLNAKERALVAQILLNKGGFGAGAEDGIMGAKTRKALDDFRAAEEKFDYILTPLSNKDVRLLISRYGSVDQSRLGSVKSAGGSGCSAFKRGSRVKFTAWYGRNTKTELVAYGTVLAVKDGDKMVVKTDGHRRPDSTVIKQGRKRNETVKCSKLSVTKY